jgi:hypothetical protein
MYEGQTVWLCIITESTTIYPLIALSSIQYYEPDDVGNIFMS